MTKLVNKAYLASRLKLSASAVANACINVFPGAVQGDRIDMSHQLVLDYIIRHDRVNGMKEGNVYQMALDHCTKTGLFSATSVQNGLQIGYNKAKAIFNVMIEKTDVPDKPVRIPQPKTKEVTTPTLKTKEVTTPTLKTKEVTKAPTTTPSSPQKPYIRGLQAKQEKKKALSLEEVANTSEDDEQYGQHPEHIHKFLDMTLRQIFKRFGTEIAFKDWLDACQKIENINEKRLKNEQTTGKLVNKALVKSAVIDVYNSAHLRIMTAGAKSITAAVISKHETGIEESVIEDHVSDLLGQYIKPIANQLKQGDM